MKFRPPTPYDFANRIPFLAFGEFEPGPFADFLIAPIEFPFSVPFGTLRGVAVWYPRAATIEIYFGRSEATAYVRKNIRAEETFSILEALDEFFDDPRDLDDAFRDLDFAPGEKPIPARYAKEIAEIEEFAAAEEAFAEEIFAELEERRLRRPGATSPERLFSRSVVDPEEEAEIVREVAKREGSDR